MDEILKISNVSKTFFSKKGPSPVLKEINLSVGRGEILAIVGESGSGKSTLLRIISKQTPFDSGTIHFMGEDLATYGKDLYKFMQMIFQDPRGSFNPKHSIGRSMEEWQKNLSDKPGVRTVDLLKEVGLQEGYRRRLAQDLSGGECQRAAIARSFSVLPKLLLCDEITSALDVSAQAMIIERLLHLVEDQGISVIFVSHDLALVSTFCHKVAVMDQGRIVEEGPLHQVLTKPKEPYTKDLIASATLG